MATVFVTGGTGFIGRRLVRQLCNRGDDVTCLVRNPAKAESLAAAGARLLPGDIGDAASVQATLAAVQPHYVFHLAGLTTSLKPAEFDRINHLGVAHVARACAALSTPPALLYVSSLAAAGPAQHHRPRTENDPPAPVSHYGRSKRAGELAAHQLADRVPITIVRPPIVFGPGDSATLEMYRPIARFGLHLVPGIKDKFFSLVHVDDLVSALMLLSEQGARLEPNPHARAKTGYYFVADQQSLSYAELGQKIGALLGRAHTKILRLPQQLVWLSAALQQFVSLGTGRPSIFGIDKAREATAGSWVCSSQRIHSTLGFAPAMPLYERLSDTLAWYREQRWL